MTRASIVIPSRAGAQRLPVLFQALTRQTHTDLEIIVVLDGDIDGSAAVVASWQDRLNLRGIVFDNNLGRSAALNAGFHSATGEVLIRCDDDLEPGPDHVALHVAHHEPNLAASLPSTSADTDRSVGVIGLCPNVFPDTPYARAYGVKRDELFREQAFAMPIGQRWRLWGANVSVTRETWRSVGDYDVAYRAYGFEDVDWGYRLHRLGHQIILDPALDAPHHGAATTTATRAQRAFHSGAARRTFEHLHGSDVLATVAAPHGVWGRLVDGAGRHTGLDATLRLATSIDRLLPLLPGYVAEKAVAFTVESAAVAGRSHAGRLEPTF